MIHLGQFTLRAPDIEALKAAQNVSGLIKLLNHNSPDVQWRAADALGAIGSVATLPLIAALGNWRTHVRLGAIEALGTIRDTRALDPLVHILEHDENVEVRWVAALALGHLGDSDAILSLIHAMRDPEKYVRYGAAKALDMLLWVPKDNHERAYYAIALQDWEYARKLETDATDPLIEMLKDRDEDMRREIIDLLGEIGTVKATSVCQMMLRDPSSPVRWQAVLSAKKCGVPITRIPWGISKRPRTGQSPWAAAILNFLFLGLGYNYLGYWWGFLVFMSYMSIIVLSQLQLGPFIPYLITYPVTAIFAVQTFFLAKRRPDL